MKMLPIFWKVLGGIMLALGAVMVLGVVLDIKHQKLLFHEYGVVETTSVVLWVVAAAVVLFIHKLAKPPQTLLYAALFCLLALREADMHKSLSGGSLLKLRFYTSGEFGGEKLLWAILAFIVIGLAAAAVIGLIQFIARRGGYKSASGQLLLIALGLLAVTKVIDRLPAVLEEKFAVTMHETVRTSCLIFEETGEVFVPLLFIAAFLQRVNPLKIGPSDTTHL